MSPYIDSHCHLADPRWSEVLDEVLARSRQAGVGRFLQGGVDPEDWERQLELARRYPGVIWPVVGLHPWWVRDPERTDSELEAALGLLAQKLKGGAQGIRALGETGLDFSGDSALSEGQARVRQLKAFEGQLELGRALRRPLVLHIVRAHGEALDILKRGGVLPAGGLVHSFSGNLEVARRYIELGLLISVGGGVVRRKGFETLKRAVIKIPAEALVLETDAPDQPPEGWLERTGLRWNEPGSLRDVASAVARLRGGTADEWLAQSTRNIERVLGK